MRTNVPPLAAFTCLAVSLAIEFCSIGSLAAMQPTPRHPALIDMLAVSPDAEGLALESVQVSVRCMGERDEATCDFVQRYRVSNISPRPVRAEVQLEAHRVVGVEVRRGDALLATHEPTSKLDVVGIGGRDFPEATRSSYAVDLELAAGEQAELRVSGTMRPRKSTDDFTFSAAKARHPVLGDNMWADRRYWVFHLEPLKSWGEVRAVPFDVDVPARWEPDWTEDLSSPVDVRDTPLVELQARIPKPAVHNGGPFVAAGAWVDDGGFVGRAGYEFGHGLYGVYSLAVDTNFEGEWTLAPVVLGATPSVFCVIPSFALGAGPAARLGNSPGIGLRGQAEVHFPYAGVVTTFDWYPAADGEPGTRFAVMGRLGF